MASLPTEVYRQLWQAHLPDAEFYPEFGVEKTWMQDDNWKRLGAVTSLKEYREGSLAWRTFAGGVIVWDDSTGGTIV